MRKCRTCNKTKSLEEFASAGVVKGKQYYRHLCIPCYSESKRPRRERVRQEYRDLKGSYKCSKCGEDDPIVLEFDHKDRKKKSFNIGDGVRRGYSIDKIKKEIEKCQVLCANCHRRKTWQENIGV